MLTIIFNGIKPNQKQFNFSVMGNAKVDIVKFVLTSPLDSSYTLEQLADFSAFVKVESAGKDYLDKIPCQSELEPILNDNQEIIGYKLNVEFELKAKTTQFRNISLQLQFESDEGRIISQTEVIDMTLKGTIDADNDLPDVYPDVLHGIENELADHEERIGDIEKVIPSGASEENKLVSHSELENGLSGKVDKEQGKGLSTNDFNNGYKSQVETNTQKVSANNGKITIQKNGTKVDDFNLNQAEDKTINIVVPTEASDVHALPDSTKYGASLLLTINSSTYVITAQLKDKDGNNLGSAQTIDLPLESVVVSGSYDSTNKKIILVLQNGNTIDVPVGDLISGLQTEITPNNKLSSDLVDDTDKTHKFVSANEKETWNAKQDALVSGTNIKTINGQSILGSGDIVIEGGELSFSDTGIYIEVE